MCRHTATLLLCVCSILCLSISLAAQIDVSTGNTSSGWQIPNSTTFQGESGTSDVVVQAGPPQTFSSTGTSGGVIFQGTPISSSSSAGGTVNPTIVRGAPNSAPKNESSGVQKGGDLYVGPGGASGTTSTSGNPTPGNDHHYSAYRKGTTSNTSGLLQCLIGMDATGGTGHNVVNDCDTAAHANNNIGIMPDSNDNFINPDGTAVYVQWGGSLKSVRSHGNEIWASGDRICVDQNNPGYVTDTGGANPCTCPATQVGYNRLNESVAGGIHLMEIVLGGCSGYAEKTPSFCQSTSGSCSGASAGSVTIAAGSTTVTVSTTAVTANSQIFVFEDSTMGSALGVTCNSSIVRMYQITSRTASTSFVITSSAAPVTNPACLNYFFVN